MGADEYTPEIEPTEGGWEPVDFPSEDGIDPNWEAELAKAIAEDGVPDDDE
jgi:hypothetical protein